MHLMLLGLLWSAAGPGWAKCRDHAFTDPRQLRLDARPVLIATHASSSFDANYSAKRGIDEAVSFARSMNIQLVYMQDDPADANYYLEDCSPDHWVHSEGGDIDFEVPVSQVLLVGGHLELCLANTFNSLVHKWSTQPLRSRTVEVLMDGVYSNGRSIEESMPFFAEVRRLLQIRSYGRPAGEHWGKVSLLEIMGAISREEQQYGYLKTVLPNWERGLPAAYRVELQVDDALPQVLQRGSGPGAPVLKFRFVDSAVTLLGKTLFAPMLE